MHEQLAPGMKCFASRRESAGRGHDCVTQVIQKIPASPKKHFSEFIRGVTDSGEGASLAAHTLLEAALARQARDNVTVVVVEALEDQSV
jgi:serine/threonine protein phosphatase PrpC